MSPKDMASDPEMEVKAMGERIAVLEDECENLRVQLEDAEQQALSFAREAAKIVKSKQRLETDFARLKERLVGERTERTEASRSARQMEQLARRLSEQDEELRTGNEELQSVLEELNLAYTALDAERAQLAERVAERTRELRVERDMFETILKTSPDSILIVDEQNTICNVSPTAVTMFGFSEAELCGRKVSTLLPQLVRRRENYFAERARGGGKRAPGLHDDNLFARRRDGTLFPVEVAVGETHFGGNHVFMGFVRDITERRQAENERRKLYAELAHAGRLVTLGEMTTAIAHEINQPLTAISTYAAACERLIDNGQLSPDGVKEIHDKISAQAARMGEIIRHFRAFVGGGRGDRARTSLNAAVEGVLPLALVGCAERGITADVTLAKRVPTVLANTLEIQQVVLNFVRNAIDAMAGEDHRHMAIKTRHNRKARCVEFSVNDTGHGLKPEVAATLFDPFVTTKEGGMGIGLSLCRTIIERHDGRIWAESNTRGGATFYFTLPLSAAERDPAAPEGA